MFENLFLQNFHGAINDKISFGKKLNLCEKLKDFQIF